MYSVLSGKPKSGQTEEQSLLKLNDQCDRLIRQIELNIERAETGRAERTTPKDSDSIHGIPKPGEDGWIRGGGRGGDGVLERDKGTGVEKEGSRLNSHVRLGLGGGRKNLDVAVASTSKDTTRRAYPAGAFRDDFSDDFSYNGSDINETVSDEVAADEAYRLGVDFLQVGDAQNALAQFKKAQVLCPPTRPQAVQKITKNMQIAKELVWSQSQQEAAENVAAADQAYRNALDCLERKDSTGAMKHLRRAETLCPLGRPAAMAKIKKLMESVELGW